MRGLVGLRCTIKKVYFLILLKETEYSTFWSKVTRLFFTLSILFDPLSLKNQVSALDLVEDILVSFYNGSQPR